MRMLFYDRVLNNNCNISKFKCWSSFIWKVLTRIISPPTISNFMTQRDHFLHIIFDYHIPKCLCRVNRWSLCCNNKSEWVFFISRFDIVGVFVILSFKIFKFVFEDTSLVVMFVSPKAFELFKLFGDFILSK